jgi:hypothetical protein
MWLPAILAILIRGNAIAFDGHVVTEGPLTLTIGEVAEITAYDTPRDIDVTLKNSGPSKIYVKLRIAGLVGEWRSVGEMEKSVEVDAGRETRATFQVVAGKDALSALYPVHVFATFERHGKTITARAVQIVSTRLEKPLRVSASPKRLPLTSVLANSVLPLLSLHTHRVAWRYYDGPLVTMPVCWTGTTSVSNAMFTRSMMRRGKVLQAFQMHPPWRPGGGTLFAQYRLRLPKVKPIVLKFSNAIRDHTATESPSDGVTFRVWGGANGKEKLFDRHTNSKTWVEGKADLSRFAGKEILLQLESHPGPRRDTTCDSAFWGAPVIIAGTPPPELSEVNREQLRQRARRIVAAEKVSPSSRNREFVFHLQDDSVAAIVLGPYGLTDGVIAFGKGRRSVVFDGLSVAILDHPVGRRPSTITVGKCSAAKDKSSSRVTIRHSLQLAGDRFDLSVTVWKEGAGLRMKVICDKRLTDIALGSADQKAPRVYYGHGYCIVEPQAFQATAGGHNLSTSHVGFDFESGISLLTASDNPPRFLEVSPNEKRYALHTYLDATLTFVPSVVSAFDCAHKYRPLYDKKAAPAFERKAGRFVFDIWKGSYADIAETMQEMIAYGLTDSLLTVHDWQHWGYDYRLPDIYPPNPSYGTVEDMQKIAEVCDAHDIPWGVHDNYIDFYPDAAGYSYDHICFTTGGDPIKAWINKGRDAQSYRLRPDRIMPFVQRNLKLIKPKLKPTHYFMDVFSSSPCFDFYDRKGRYHSMLETRKHWGEAFTWIRDFLGDGAPMTSEGGHDQLIGYLDGADCQHLQLTPVDKRFCINLKCKDWERVPWFDAVLHDKFSLHGVGYSGRYQGGRSRLLHGIESDDYISAELLGGHALMIDWPAFNHGAVRKYWLAQDIIRGLAKDRIANVTFARGNIHRQTVTWESGAKIHVNRGRTDWIIAGKRLPPYGYAAKMGDMESSIERRGGLIVEQSRDPSRFYVNGRGFQPNAPLRIQPEVASVEYLGGRRFKMPLTWHADLPAPVDLDIFVHFDSDRPEDWGKIAFQGDHRSAEGTSTWRGRVTTGANHVIEIARACKAGQYNITVGLFDPSSDLRYPLLGDNDGNQRYLMGKLIVDGQGEKVTDVRFVKHPIKPLPPSRWNVRRAPVDFGLATTWGAFRCEHRKSRLVVTPLPDGINFPVSLRIDKITGRKEASVKSIIAEAKDGEKIRRVDFESTGKTVTFRTRKGEFAYVISLGQSNTAT